MKIQVGEFLARLIAPIFSSAPSSRQTGEIWYESTANKFKGQKSSGPVDLEGGTGGSSLSYSSVTSDQSIAVGTFYGVDCTNGNVILTLGSGTSAGETLSVKKTDSTDNTVTINGNIDGETSIIISFEDETIDLYWNGSTYLIN